MRGVAYWHDSGEGRDLSPAKRARGCGTAAIYHQRAEF